MFKKLSIYAVAVIGAITILSSCEKEYEKIETIDQNKLEKYIAGNSAQYTKDSTGYYYRITNPGEGENFRNTDSVLYTFVIKSLEGKTYYDTQSDAQNIGNLVGYADKIILNRSVPALRRAILEMKPGGAAEILLPSYLAFGKNGESSINIPSNEPLLISLNILKERSQAERDDNLIRSFLERNQLNAARDTSGVYYIIEKPGSGTTINQESTVYAFYTGRLLDGTEFDSNTADTTVSFSLKGGTIEGWRRGLPHVKEGGKMRLFVPSGLGYGGNNTGKIKMNSVLDFDIEARKVTN